MLWGTQTRRLLKGQGSVKVYAIFKFILCLDYISAYSGDIGNNSSSNHYQFKNSMQGITSMLLTDRSKWCWVIACQGIFFLYKCILYQFSLRSGGVVMTPLSAFVFLDLFIKGLFLKKLQRYLFTIREGQVTLKDQSYT